jgi:hypothetical protein
MAPIRGDDSLGTARLIAIQVHSRDLDFEPDGIPYERYTNIVGCLQQSLNGNR